MVAWIRRASRLAAVGHASPAGAQAPSGKSALGGQQVAPA